MRIYLDSGYLNVPALLERGLPFVFCYGGRGTGKTFGALEYARVHYFETGDRFILLRRLQSQIDLINKPEYSPFKAVDLLRGWEPTTTKSVSKYTSGFYVGDDCIGYTAALSTFANMRGFDASDCALIIYDEFIPEAHERPLKNELAALLNSYETVNRNRELNGKPPVQLLALANANNLGNPIFDGLGLVDTVQRMERKGQSWREIRDRGILLVRLDASRISAAKSETALYKLARGTEFEAMSIANRFASLDSWEVRAMPINEYRPIAQLGDICFYRHKSRPEYYITDKVSGSPPKFADTKMDVAKFVQRYGWIGDRAINGKCIFSSAGVKVRFMGYLQL